MWGEGGQSKYPEIEEWAWNYLHLLIDERN